MTALNARIQEAIPGIQSGDEASIATLREVSQEAAAAGLPGPEATARGLLGQALLHFGRRGLAFKVRQA